MLKKLEKLENKFKALVSKKEINLIEHNIIIGHIHPNDDMLFKIDGKYVEDSYLHYNKVGQSALKNIEDALEAANIKFSDIKCFLDLPSGYGRVLRVLQTKIEPNRITACDLNEEAVRFCNSEFGVEPLISNLDFNKINFNKKYDLIWVGSLFTHLNPKSFSILLEVLYSILNDKGILVFTTHGEYSLDLINDKRVYNMEFPEKEKIIEILKNEGYYYISNESSKEYGISICRTNHIFSEMDKKYNGKLKLLLYKYRGWDNHQDVYAFQRTV